MMRHVTTILLSCLTLAMGAQNKIGELFKAMPDSLMPLLTTNNRLDMIDFMDARMSARVVNRLEGQSEMTLLTDDSLSIRMSSVMEVSLTLVPTEIEYDSCHQVICMETCYQLPSSGATETTVRYYTTQWNPLLSPSITGVRKTLESTILRRDEEVLQVEPIM